MKTWIAISVLMLGASFGLGILFFGPAELVVVYIGIMCGIAASIPVSAGLLFLLARPRAVAYDEPVEIAAPGTWEIVETAPLQLSAPAPKQLPK